MIRNTAKENRMGRRSLSSLTRRDALKLLAGAGTTAAGAYALYEFAPWLDYDRAAGDARESSEGELSVTMPMRELVRFAALAASGHNAQPWMFSITENVIEIHPDYSRRLPIVDPADRALWISLGCALENLLIASRAAGYAAKADYPDAEDFIRVRLAADTPRGGSLFDAIPARQNTRSTYDGMPVESGSLDRLRVVPLEPGAVIHIITERAGLETVAEYVRQGNLYQYADKAFLDELIRWLRFNKREALAARDGLYTRCTGNPEVPRWLGGLFVSGTRPQQQADADSKKLRGSSGAIVIATETDDRASWVRAGQVYERLALTMTSLNIQSAFLNQPIEAAEVRGQFQNAVGLGLRRPQLLVRFGHAGLMPRSLRRPVEQVLI
jgi:hypothetical protein